MISTSSPTLNEIIRLQKQIAALTSENAQLKEQLHSANWMINDLREKELAAIFNGPKPISDHLPKVPGQLRDAQPPPIAPQTITKTTELKNTYYDSVSHAAEYLVSTVDDEIVGCSHIGDWKVTVSFTPQATNEKSHPSAETIQKAESVIFDKRINKGKE